MKFFFKSVQIWQNCGHESVASLFWPTLYTPARPEKTDEAIAVPFWRQTYVGPMNHVLDGTAYWRHMSNAISERFVRGGDAAFCQITLITCYRIFIQFVPTAPNWISWWHLSILGWSNTSLAIAASCSKSGSTDADIVPVLRLLLVLYGYVSADLLIQAGRQGGGALGA